MFRAAANVAAPFFCYSRVMHLLTAVLIGYVILFHFFAFIMESFLWRTPFGMKTFRITRETAEASYGLAVSQGVYNFFITAGLLWSLTVTDPFQSQLQIFFLSCALAAGITAGLSVSKRIMMLQGLPALVALVLIFFAR